MGSPLHFDGSSWILVQLFEKRSLPEEFKTTHWPNGRTAKGIASQHRYLRIKQRYEDILEGKTPSSDEMQEEADQQFAAEANLRDFLAKNPASIEAGPRLYERNGKPGVEFRFDGGQIDLLCTDAQQRFVVIELKFGEVETGHSDSFSITWVGLTATLGTGRAGGDPARARRVPSPLNARGFRCACRAEGNSHLRVKNRVARGSEFLIYGTRQSIQCVESWFAPTHFSGFRPRSDLIRQSKEYEDRTVESQYIPVVQASNANAHTQPWD